MHEPTRALKHAIIYHFKHRVRCTAPADVSLAICVLAKDEGKSIGHCLRQLAAQSLIRNRIEVVEIHVVANGTTDDTVAVAQGCAGLFVGSRAKLQVHDIHPGGKSRAWNRTVHEFASPDVDTFIFLDADVTFTGESVLDDMLSRLSRDMHLAAYSSFPLKDVATKSKKTPLDRFSLFVSGRTRHLEVINGQLYVARASALRDLWLPDQIPGEDGFLNGMLCTRGFTQPADLSLVSAMSEPTHYFHSHRPLEFVSHERRMIVGTIINRWIFEHLWSLKLTSPAGPLIRDWNERDPAWIDRLINQRAVKNKWLIPSAILFSRFKKHADRTWWRYASYMPVATAAFLLTLPPAILANKRLKEVGAAATW